MLSRTNSDVASRLRRAKSASSVQKSHQPPAIAVDVRYAEFAAVEAYHRASQQTHQATKPRRRGSRRSEGSHFDNNRRKSAQRPALSSAVARPSLLPDTPYRSALEVSNDSTISDISDSRISTTSRRLTRDFQTDDEIKAAAWDAYLQDFHKKDVRQKRSFVAPIRKRFSKSPTPPTAIRYDTSVPPYNLAGESDDMFSTVKPIEMPPVEVVQTSAPVKLKKKPVVSESLKGKFRQLLGRPKRVQTQFPAQHVEAKNLHFDVYKTRDDSLSACAEAGVSLPKSPFPSLGASSGSKSRVTSWSNSTASAYGRRLPSIEESTAVGRHGSRAKEPSTSLFGRALRLPQRRTSQTALCHGTEDNYGLYAALRERIDGPEEYLDPADNTAAMPTIVVEDAVSEQNVMLHDESPQTPTLKTVRAVTPESPTDVPELPRRPAPSPPAKVTRKSSWWSIAVKKKPHARTEDAPSLRTSTSTRVVSGPTAPSKEQIASRVERSENRWQTALEDSSPIVSRARDYCIKGENPYELRPLDSYDQNNSFPVAVRHDVAARPLVNGAILNDIRQHVISPSVYSRESECRSTTPDGGIDGMFITITGREVKRYPLDSPPKPVNGVAYNPKPSNEWKAWLSKELEDFNMSSGPEDLTLSGNDCFPSATPGSVAGSSEIQALKTRRPQMRTRTSSIMNERYPLIDTGRPPSRASGRRINHSSADSSAHRTASGSAASGASEGENTSSKGSRLGDPDQPPSTQQSKIRERQSTSALVHNKSILASRAAHYEYGPPPTESDSVGRKESVKAPKSALDLRVTYRNNRNLEPSSLNIRRKPGTPVLLDDHTLHKISEGPYASDKKKLRENATPIMPVDSMTIPPFYTPARSSPGQRMVDDFLNSRKGMGSSPSPVFI